MGKTPRSVTGFPARKHTIRLLARLMVYYVDVKDKYEVLYKHVLKKFIHTGSAMGL
ncbi:MAG: hypothetical protein JJU16_07465 [Alkalibacterium sp.]|nr:hypothetical protein [Alkalibacterium sp.]